MKHLVGLMVLSFLSFAAIASDPVLTCKITNPKNKKMVDASLNLAKLDQIDTEASSGINIGKDNYNFNISVEEVRRAFEINVTFYENNRVQDEVGGMSCVYKISTGRKVFCEVPLTNEQNKIVALFSCLVK